MEFGTNKISVSPTSVCKPWKAVHLTIATHFFYMIHQPKYCLYLPPQHRSTIFPRLVLRGIMVENRWSQGPSSEDISHVALIVIV
jgi:hypothetical protein